MQELKLSHNHCDEKDVQELYKDINEIKRFDIALEPFKKISDTTRPRIFFILCHREECVINLFASYCCFYFFK